MNLLNLSSGLMIKFNWMYITALEEINYQGPPATKVHLTSGHSFIVGETLQQLGELCETEISEILTSAMDKLEASQKAKHDARASKLDDDVNEAEQYFAKPPAKRKQQTKKVETPTEQQ